MAGLHKSMVPKPGGTDSKNETPGFQNERFCVRLIGFRGTVVRVCVLAFGSGSLMCSSNTLAVFEISSSLLESVVWNVFSTGVLGRGV